MLISEKQFQHLLNLTVLSVLCSGCTCVTSVNTQNLWGPDLMGELHIEALKDLTAEKYKCTA
jgi:hypothetical protein